MKDHVSKPVDAQILYAQLQHWCKPAAALPVPPEATGESGAPAAIASPPAPNDRLPPLAGIDTETLQKRMRGRAATCRRLLNAFREQFQDYPARLNPALENQDFPSAGKLAHALKGVAGNIAAMDLHQSAANLDHACDGGDPALCREAAARCLADLARVLESVASLEP